MNTNAELPAGLQNQQWIRPVSRFRSYDVVVVGAGAAGVAAAVAAAKAGASTLLVERYPVLGGTTVVSGVASFQIGPDVHGQPIVRGHYANVMRRLHEEGVLQGRSFNGEVLKIIYLLMCEEAGVDLLLHGSFTGASIEDGTITHIAVETKSGLEAISAKVFIDCSADGDVGFAAGAPTESGRPGDGRKQPLTLYVTMKHVQREMALEVDPDDYYPLFEQQLSHISTSHVRLTFGPRFNVTRDGRMTFPMMHIRGVDGANADELTHAEIRARKQAYEIWHFFRDHVPGFGESVLDSTPFQIGIRETRRVMGDYIMSRDSIIGCVKHEDTIGRSNSFNDVHNPEGEGTLHEYIAPDDWYDIPYRALIARNVTNLLVAGRCMSSTHWALGSLREQPTCMVTGQGAGVAAAVAANTGAALRDVDIPSLQRELINQGVDLEPRFNQQFPPMPFLPPAIGPKYGQPVPLDPDVAFIPI